MLVLRNVCRNVFCLFLLIWASTNLFSQSFDNVNAGSEAIGNKTLKHCLIKENNLIGKSFEKSQGTGQVIYYLYVSDFISSLIEIPTSTVSVDSSTIASQYLAGRAPIYNLLNQKVGTCSASFLCMQNADGIFTDISNYLSVDNGLIVSWFTPTTLINLELDTIINSMVTECIVLASTKIGFNPFYGKKFNMIVSSDNEKIYFILTKI